MNVQSGTLGRSVADSETIRNHAAFIWSVADLLRGDYKQSEYGKVILPLTVLRRLDCVLEPTKQDVLDLAEKYAGRALNLDPILEKAAGQQFFNTSRYDFGKLLDAPDDLADNLSHYIASFSTMAGDIIEKFDFRTQIARLDRSNLLYLVVSKFAEIDLHPDVVSNLEMGYLYEELLGVADDGTIHGIESDYASHAQSDQDPRDRFQQHLANLTAASMGDAAATNVRPYIHHVDGHDICRVQVDPSAFPVDAKVVYQKPNQTKQARTEFFVRVANGTKALDAVERERYIAGRWGAGAAA